MALPPWSERAARAFVEAACRMYEVDYHSIPHQGGLLLYCSGRPTEGWHNLIDWLALWISDKLHWPKDERTIDHMTIEIRDQLTTLLHNGPKTYATDDLELAALYQVLKEELMWPDDAHH
ncbi:MAG: hypothetical protein L0Z62_36465 [Gemmataceae bacterium]|nr:hypothetical protein [Gemmataceae bacterium]